MKSKNFSDSFKYAWQGVRHAAMHERNFKIHLVMAALAIAACIVLKVDTVLLLFVVISIFFVLIMELFNTAIEALTDMYCGNRLSPFAKIAKDTAAAAVLLASVQAVIVAAIVAVSVLRRFLN